MEDTMFGGFIDPYELYPPDTPLDFFPPTSNSAPPLQVSAFDEEQLPGSFGSMNFLHQGGMYTEYLFSTGLADSIDQVDLLASEPDEVHELKQIFVSSLFDSYFCSTRFVEAERGDSVQCLPDNLVQSAMQLLHDTSDHSAALTHVCSDKSEGSGAVPPGPAHRNRRGKTKFTCPYDGCEKTEAKKYAMKVHIRRHTGEKPFVCTWEGCTWRFCRSDELNRHMRSHTGEKRHNCNICNRAFLRADHLAKHLKTHGST